MSDKTPVVDNDCKKGIDPSLDITSEHFDPLKALYSDNVYIPYKNAKVYDNISKFESAVMRSKTNEATTSTASLSNARTNTAKVNNRFRASDEPVVRRFLPHQRKLFIFFIPFFDN